ncbi:MAG: isoprenylcysteine carboxylmethyltransferase family protein [bacterium]|nr:isoprenylcysteine carboxylmethyltransferase family protein [bacterium]
MVRNILLNSGLLGLCLLAAWGTRFLDQWFGFMNFQSLWSIIVGGFFILFGLIFRCWATANYYKHQLRVLELRAQRQLVTSGPFHYTRNPLYVGIMALWLGAVLIFGTVVGALLVITLYVFIDVWLRFFEEKDLEKKFGNEYRDYVKAAPRWL